MKNITKKMTQMVSFLLVGVMLINDGSALTVLASNNSQIESGTPIDRTVPSVESANTDAVANTSSIADINTDTKDININNAENKSDMTGDSTEGVGSTVSGNTVDLEIPPCIDDKTHEYKEIFAEDNSVSGYCCVYCAREISVEDFTTESAQLHIHEWKRAEDEVIPLCLACGEVYHSCDGEDSIGVHVYELIQGEGMEDSFRCIFCGEEKAILDEWEITKEQYEEIMGSSMFALYQNETSRLPTTLEDLEKYEGNEFLVGSYADLIAMQKLSDAGFDFKDYKIGFSILPGNNETWELTKLTADEFSGLGSQDKPFAGTLTTFYDYQSLRFETKIPFLKYVATGATINQLQIKATSSFQGSDTAPLGVIAANVVKADGSDTVNVSKITMVGKIINASGSAGALFGEVKNTTTDPIKLCYDETVEIGISGDTGFSVDASNAGLIAGKTIGNVEVYRLDKITADSTVKGKLNAGMLVGVMDKASETGLSGKLVLDGSTGYTINASVSSSTSTNNAGGLVGSMMEGEIYQPSSDQSITVNGTVAGRNSSGGIVGYSEGTKINADNITVNASVGASNSKYSGGIIGYYYDGLEKKITDEYNLIENITINQLVRASTSAGGVVGNIASSNFKIETVTINSVANNTGNAIIYANTYTGGIIGELDGKYIEIDGAVVKGTMGYYSATTGGIIGFINGSNSKRSIVKVSNVEVSSYLFTNSSEDRGGVFGKISNNSMLALDGKINLKGLSFSYNSLNRGYIGGSQTESLVYFEESCDYQRLVACRDDIGNYGGVYRNGAWGEEGLLLISYEDGDVKEKEVTQSSGEWILDTEADAIRLAIMLNTEGRFAKKCFPDASKAELLMATYKLDPVDGSMDLENSGIYAFNRNDSGTNAKKYFQGQFVGDASGGSKVSIKLGAIDTDQSNLSLFPYVGEGAIFENLQIVRTINYARSAAAGIACYGENNITVKNVEINMNLIGYSSTCYYGGFFAQYTANKGTELIIEKCIIDGIITTYSNNRIGGILATYTTAAGTGDLPIINVNEFEIKNSITSSGANTSSMITQIDASTNNVMLKLQDITIADNAELTINTSDRTAGGFLGKEWTGIEPYTDEVESYSIKKLTIGSGSVASKPTFSSYGNFGGLVNTVTGRIQLQTVNIKSGTFKAQSYKNYNGLLFYKGYNALIEITEYHIDSTNVKIEGVSDNFDEIVGYNMTDGDDPTKNTYYLMGGIVNIIDTKFDGDKMELYKNQLVDKKGNVYKSDKTRYYYNLFGLSLIDSTIIPDEDDKLDKDNMVISTPNQMMIWHLTQYMSDKTRKYLAPYYKNTGIPNRNSITKLNISGAIDLKGKSYYPTPNATDDPNKTIKIEINAIGSAKIIFYGDLINTEAPHVIQPSDMSGEHYMMHGGLLLGASDRDEASKDEVTVQGGEQYLTLSGVITNLGTSSGALFTHVITGIKNIYHIKLEDLYIHGYDKDSAHGCGLLIGQVIDNSKLDISWIKTVGYNEPSKGKAASALIGTVGDQNAKDLSIDFTNIKLNDASTDKGVFKYATLIDIHDYTDDTENNIGRVRYLFTEEAYKGEKETTTNNEPKAPFMDAIHGENNYSEPYVTIGNELKDGVEYWNTNYGPEAKPGTMPGDDTTPWGNNWSDYLPYVCQTHAEAEKDRGKDIEVNPKHAEIVDGCGTYEDPYQISSAKQLLTLARYITNPDDYKYLDGWEINEYQGGRDGGDFCSNSHEKQIYIKDEYKKEDSKFPSRDELRQAYYQIIDNINLTDFTSVTDKKIAEEFVGLGVAGYPFTGVIVGKDGIDPIITLPNKKRYNSCTNFGLIQYAKGAVVKDVQVQNDQSDIANIDKKFTNIAQVESNGGTIIACILGGDNIIDNVTVNNAIAAKTDNAKIGGYVGSIQQGSLILRNLKQEQLENFKSGTLASGGRNLDAFADLDSHASYLYVSGMIGRVENGYVIYEDELSPFNGVILPNADIDIAGVYKNNVLPISKTYNILTASGLSNEKNSIQISLLDDDFECNVTNTEQLQLVSMAINSDAFSVYYGGGGYDKLASCRKAQYNEVGTDSETGDFKAATKKDDQVYWYPYIYNYFTFDDTKAMDSDKLSTSGFYTTLIDEGTLEYRSNLNAVTKDVSSKMTYKLVNGSEDIDYDLSVYKRGFRGLGATYRVFSADSKEVNLNVLNGIDKDNYIYSDFRANFNGNGATVKAEMTMDYEDSIHTVALFNDLIGLDWTDNRVYEINNLIVTGSFRNDIDKKAVFSTNTPANNAGNRAGALVGMMYRPWKITEVTAKDVVVISDGYAAGIVAWINPNKSGTATENELYEFKECNLITKTAEKEITSKAGSSGGIIGMMAPSCYDNVTTTNTMNYLALTLEDCSVKGTDDNNTDKYVDIKVNEERTSKTNDECHYGTGRSGALIGYAGKRRNERGSSWDYNYQRSRVNIKIDISQTAKDVNNPNIQYVKVDGGDSSGGVIGEYYSGGYDGALVAERANIKIKNICVSDSLIQSHNMRNYDAPRMGTGGIVGSVGRGITCTVTNTDLINTNVTSLYKDKKDDIPAGGIIGFCYYKTKAVVNNVTVKGDIQGGNRVNSISTHNSHVGGVIGFADMSAEISIPKAEVRDILIKSDNRIDASKNTNSSDARVGGLIGLAHHKADIGIYSTDEDNYPDPGVNIENCVILGGNQAVGGVIGGLEYRSLSGRDYVNTYTIYSYPTSNLKKVSVKKCNIGVLTSHINKTKVGGIYGYVYGNSSYKISMTDKVTVDHCNIYGYYTGGIAGHVSNTLFGTDDSTKAEIQVNESNILGLQTGGIMGYNNIGSSSYKTVISNAFCTKNAIIAVNPFTNNSLYSYAGGVFGHYNQSDGTGYLDNINLSENKIISNNAYSQYFNNPLSYANMGGVYGYIDMGSATTKFYNYNIKLTDNEIGYFVKDASDLNAILSDSGSYQQIIDFMQASHTEEAKLLDSSSKLKVYDSGMPVALTENEIGNYSRQIGNLVGGYNITGKGYAYFVKPQVEYADTYNKVRPVVDVGNAGTPSSDTTDKLLSYPYNYRRNIQIIYQDPDTSVENTAAAVWGSSVNVDEKEKEKNRLFSQVNAEAILDAYKSADNTDKRLNAYRLNVTDDRDNTVSKMFEYVYKDNKDKYLSAIKVDGGMETLPMIVLDTQYGTTDQMLTSVLAALTGVGGVQNSGGTEVKDSIYDLGIYNIADISVKAMQVESGVIKDAPGTASLKADKQNNRWEIVYQGYNDVDIDGNGTFSLITITYGNKEHYTSLSPSGILSRTITLQIPVFVIERLTIDTHFKLLGGEVYNTDVAKKNGIVVDAFVANDSTYTIYNEYIYGNARYKYSKGDGESAISIGKTIGFQYKDASGNLQWDSFFKGTKLTLIDKNDSDKAYFYDVTGEDERIEYTDFQDINGNGYKNKKIHDDSGMEIHKGKNDKFITWDKVNDEEEQYVDKRYEYEDVAVEKFLIIVDTSNISKQDIGRLQDSRFYTISPIVDDITLQRTTLTDRTKLQVVRLPGLSIELDDKTTKIDGRINHDTKVTIDGDIVVSGNEVYWEKTTKSPESTIDTANHAKYLELAIYLTDEAGNRINLPNHTSVSIDGERIEPSPESIIGGEEGKLGAYTNENTVYFYKDGKIRYSLDELKPLIEKKMETTSSRTHSVIVRHGIELDFSNADLKDYTAPKYGVHLDLIRIEEADYPAGGELIDDFSQMCAGATRTGIACALEAEDLLQLGINTFENQTEMPHTIDFDFKLDFNGVLGRGDEANNEIASKYYTVTYRLLEKTNRNGTPEYIPYIGDQLYFDVDSPLGEILQKGASSTGNEINSRYITYKFDLSEIEDGTNNELEGVITRKLGLTVLDANEMDLSNYKIQASVMVSDAPPNDIDQQVNTSLSDFLVFTIAKLKTDLDY